MTFWGDWSKIARPDVLPRPRPASHVPSQDECNATAMYSGDRTRLEFFWMACVCSGIRDLPRLCSPRLAVTPFTTSVRFGLIDRTLKPGIHQVTVVCQPKWYTYSCRWTWPSPPNCPDRKVPLFDVSARSTTLGITATCLVRRYRLWCDRVGKTS